MGKKNIKFYGTNDLSLYSSLPKIKEFIEEFIEEPRDACSFEEAMEIQNVIKYIDADIFPVEWTASFIENMKNTKSQLIKSASMYLQKVTRDEILLGMDNLYFEYRDDFFKNFQHYDYSKKVNENEFMAKFIKVKIPIQYLLKYKYFVDSYPNSLKDYILSDSLSIELLLSNFINSNESKLYFPSNITNDDWNTLLEEYIDNPLANLNYLSILENPIKNFDKNKYFSITPKQKLRIINRSRIFSRSIVKENSGVLVNLIVHIDRNNYYNNIQNIRNEMELKEALDHSIIASLMQSTGEYESQEIKCSMLALIDKNLLIENHNYESLLKYFRSDFDFFSKRLISTLPSYPNKEIGPVARSLGVKTNNSYEYGFYFSNKIALATFKIKAISQILTTWDLRIENLISFFFNDYCKKIYNISWIQIIPPHKDESIQNQTATLFRIEESIRKQYLILSEENVIEYSLVNETPTPDISHLKSLFPKKFVYLNDNNIANDILFLLFSDQSTINYIDEKLKGNDFVDLILNHKLRIIDFHEYQKENISFLIENKIIEEENEFLKLSNLLKVELLREIYLYDSTSYVHASKEEQDAIKEMENDNLIVFTNTLFTNQEIDFLNFLLNNKFFDNSWAIRNKYQHGTPHYDNSSEYDYDNSIALLILTLYIIRIDDELKLQN